MKPRVFDGGKDAVEISLGVIKALFINGEIVAAINGSTSKVFISEETNLPKSKVIDSWRKSHGVCSVGVVKEYFLEDMWRTAILLHLDNRR